MKVKICGIRNEESAITASEAGADFLGFIFVPQSKRYIAPDRAKKIIAKIKGKIKVVGVFKNQLFAEVKTIINMLSLDMVQLHGSEPPEFCRSLQAKVIKAFPVKPDFQIGLIEANIKRYIVDYYLLDREKQGKGAMINLNSAKLLAAKYPLFFAGGLTPENIIKVVQIVQPYAVDVTSGIETDGAEDSHKIHKFIKNAKGAII